jgi:hypothetical protein
VEAKHEETIEKRERDGCASHDVPVQFGSSVKMYFVKNVSVKENSTNHETIHIVG